MINQSIFSKGQAHYNLLVQCGDGSDLKLESRRGVIKPAPRNSKNTKTAGTSAEVKRALREIIENTKKINDTDSNLKERIIDRLNTNKHIRCIIDKDPKLAQELKSLNDIIIRKTIRAANTVPQLPKQGSSSKIIAQERTLQKVKAEQTRRQPITTDPKNDIIIRKTIRAANTAPQLPKQESLSETIAQERTLQKVRAEQKRRQPITTDPKIETASESLDKPKIVPLGRRNTQKISEEEISLSKMPPRRELGIPPQLRSPRAAKRASRADRGSARKTERTLRAAQRLASILHPDKPNAN